MKAYESCKWCGGSGCLGCEGERERDMKDAFNNPLMTVHTDNPVEMKSLKRVFSRESLEHAFSKEGDGMTEIYTKIVVEKLNQDNE